MVLKARAQERGQERGRMFVLSTALMSDVIYKGMIVGIAYSRQSIGPVVDQRETGTCQFLHSCFHGHPFGCIMHGRPGGGYRGYPATAGGRAASVENRALAAPCRK
jgi:hypothetical protein